MIAILILAAGNSSRMRGRDKLMEDVDGMALLRRMVLRAQATGRQVTVALPAAPHPRYAALEGLDIKHISVPDAARGMNTSLRAGLVALHGEVQAVMILLADMPDLTTEDMNAVLTAVDLSTDTRIWRATTQAGAAGHPILFHHALFAALIALDGDQGGAAVVKANAAQTLLIPLPENHARTDLDTPEEWDAWRKRQHSI